VESGKLKAESFSAVLSTEACLLIMHHLLDFEQ